MNFKHDEQIKPKLYKIQQLMKNNVNYFPKNQSKLYQYPQTKSPAKDKNSSQLLNLKLESAKTFNYN